MRKMSLSLFLAAAAAAAATAGSASAAVVFSENFNDVGFEASTNYVTGTTDRFGATNFYTIADYNGWTFTGNTPYYDRSQSSADGALQLNETSGAASRTITGLTVGATYFISLLLSGDDQPGQTYNFQTTLNGSNVISTTGVDGSSGSNPGTVLTGSFVASATQMTLGLSQTGTSSAASPVIDNISISSVPEVSTWAMMLLGFGATGMMIRRRRNAIAHAI